MNDVMRWFCVGSSHGQAREALEHALGAREGLFPAEPWETQIDEECSLSLSLSLFCFILF